MFNRRKIKGLPRRKNFLSRVLLSLRGQNVTEYLILMAGVLVVVIVAASPKGFFTQGVNKALNMMFDVDGLLE